MPDGRLAVIHGAGEWRLDLLDPDDGVLTPLGLPHTGWSPSIDAYRRRIAAVAGAPGEPAVLVQVDAATGREQVVRRSAPESSQPYLPAGYVTTFTGRDGHQVHATVYPPHHPEVRADPGARVPYLLCLTDGPGEQHADILDMATAFFTSRGLGVVDVHGRGVSGFGRTYREHVYGQWGVADVEDCAVVASNLVARWDADPSRLVARGVGAGGTTALATLANSDVCAAATVYGAVTDLDELGPGSGYGPGRYLREIAADSVLLRTSAWLDRIRRPVLICHGEDDAFVPLAQALLLRDALRRNRVPHTCLTFPREGHVIRRADVVARALEAELSFYGKALGFTPPDTPGAPLAGADTELGEP